MIERLLDLSGQFSMLVPCYKDSGLWPEAFCRSSGGRMYGVEIDRVAVENVLSPCEFLKAKISPRSFSIAYLTPPITWKRSELPSEFQYAQATTRCLVSGGVLVALVSSSIATSNYSPFFQHINENYENVSISCDPTYAFYVIVIGVKRKNPVDGESRAGEVKPFNLLTRRYLIPATGPPKFFEKVGYTKDELMDILSTSPLRSVFTSSKIHRKPTPPLELGIGHIASMLASGQVDGLINVPGFEPHVVRGLTRKDIYTKELREEESRDGSLTSVKVESERVVPVIRAAWRDGRIERYE